MNYQLSFPRLFFIVVIFSCFYSAFNTFCFQDSSVDYIDLNNSPFSIERSYNHWMNLTKVQGNRPISSSGFNISYRYVLETAKKYKSIAQKNGILNVTISEQFGIIRESKVATIMSIQKDVRNILVSIHPLNKNDDKLPVLISAHIDGHNTGPGAYDDAAGIAAMLELMNVICESKVAPKNPVIFLFVGVEEQGGLPGSKLFLQNSLNFSSFLNIESIGTGLPLGVMQKGCGSAAMINALKRTKGLIFATIADDVTQLGLISSTSDTVRFRENGLPGAELLFIGNPTKYHTKFDEIGSKNHLHLLGNSLYDFINNFDAQSINPRDDMIAIGYSPFVIAVSKKFLKVFSKSLVIIALCSFVFIQIKIKLFLVAIIIPPLIWILITLTFIGVGYLMFLFNSLSIAVTPPVSFIVLSFSGAAMFLTIFNVVSSLNFRKKATPYDKAYENNEINESFLSKITPTAAQFALVFFNSFMVILTTGFDISVLFILQLGFSTIASFFIKNAPILSFVFNSFGFVATHFTFSLLFNFMTVYSSIIPGMIADLVPYLLICLYLLPFLFYSFPFIIQPKHIEISKKRYLFGLLISILILLVPILFPPPFSTEFNIQGTLSHIIDRSNGSYVSFIPNAGKRAFNGINYYLKDPSKVGIKYIEQFQTPLAKSDIYYRNISSEIPPYIVELPKYNIQTKIHSTKDFERTVSFSVTNSDQLRFSISFIINCSNTTCLKNVDGFGTDFYNYKKIKERNSIYFIRVIPGFEPFDINFIVSELEHIPMRIAFSWQVWSDELKQFLSEFPDFVQPMGKMGSIADTSLVDYVYI